MTTRYLSSQRLGTDESHEVKCDLCLSRNYEFLALSRGGSARAVICRRCGLIFISPRHSREWYERYYQEEYRSRGGELADPAAIFEKGYRHGRALAIELKPYLLSGGLLIEVGSSSGGVLSGMRDQLGVGVLGIEPSEREARYAASRGIPTRRALVEDIAARSAVLPAADQILSAQSLNHFLSPRSFFVWAWQALKPKGRLIVEVKNFRQQVRRSGRMGNSVQLDHLYMFTPETVKQYLKAAGFRTLILADDEGLSLRAIARRRAAGLPGWQIRAVAEKSSTLPFSAAAAAIDPAAYRRVSTSLQPWRVAFHHYLRYRWLKELLPEKLRS